MLTCTCMYCATLQYSFHNELNVSSPNPNQSSRFCRHFPQHTPIFNFSYQVLPIPHKLKRKVYVWQRKLETVFFSPCICWLGHYILCIKNTLHPSFLQENMFYGTINAVVAAPVVKERINHVCIIMCV